MPITVLARGLKAALSAAVVAISFQAAVATEGAASFPDTSRIVAIGGSLTEIVYALDEQDKLVARDSTGLYPPEAVKLPDVGYIRALSPEGVLSVNPTGILALEGSGPKEAVDVLKKAAVPYIEVPETYDRAGIVGKIRAVGKALGADAKAEQLAVATDEKLTKAEALTKDIGTRKRVLFVLSMQGGKILASGDGTAASGIMQMAGAENAVAGFPGYKQLSDEAVLEARPDVILMMDRGGDHGAANDQLFKHPAIATTPAGQNQSIVRMDGGYLLGFGPRTADAIHDLAVALYGDQIKD